MTAGVAANVKVVIGAAFDGAFKSVFGQADSRIKQIGTTVQNLERKQKLLNESIQTFGRMGKNVDSLRQQYVGVTQELERQRAELLRITKIEAARKANLDNRARLKGELRGATTQAAVMGAPVVGAIVQAARFETAMLGVAKQVEGARDASGKLTDTYFQMRKQIRALGGEIPIATNEIAEMVAAGARMGIARDQLIGFVNDTAKMASAFDLPAAELADQMGKISNLFKIPIPAIGDLADTINYLDDNAIAKGGDLIEFLTRTGGIASSVKITAQNTAALGSTLLSLGERAETASSATNALFQKLGAAESQSKPFKAALADIGLTARELQRAMQVDAQGTILEVLNRIKALPQENQLAALTDLFGLEHSDTISKLAQNMGEYRRQIELANSAAAKGSMGREFNAQLATTNAQWVIAKNRLSDIGVAIGTILLPGVNAVLGVVGKVATAIGEFAENNKVLVGTIIAVGTALTGLRIGILAAQLAWTFIIPAIGQATTLLGALATAVRFAGTAFMFLGRAMFMNPIGLVIAGIAALVAIGWVLYENWDTISKGVGAAFTYIKDAAIAAFEGLKSAVGAVIDWLAAKLEWVFGAIAQVRAGAASVGSIISSGWQGAQNLVGMGGDAPADTSAAVPSAAATAAVVPVNPRASNAGVTVNTNASITVNGSPDPKATAAEVRKQLDARDRDAAAAARSGMTDAMGY